MIKIETIYGFEPDEHGDPLEWWFTVFSSSGENASYIQSSDKENRAKIEEFITWVRGRHPGETIVDCTGTC